MDALASQNSGLLSDRVRDALTDAIAAGEFAAGATLDEQQLADRFGTSRTPVREALRQLTASGLAELRPRRGVIVARLTPARLMDMFETMAEIEATCARLATYRITPLERAELIRIHDASLAAVNAADVDSYDQLNRAFHEAIYRATHNGFLIEQAIGVRERLNAFRRLQLRQGGRLPRSRGEHDAVMRAIAEGDGEDAARKMRAHMLNAATALDQYLADRGLSEPA